MSSLAELIALLREKRVRIWEDAGDLKLSASREALTPELTATLKARKPELLAFLRNAGNGSTARHAIAAAPRGSAQPLSFAQERLWFLEKLGGTGAAYHVAGAVRILGRLDAPAFARAFVEVQRRHDVLRARFIEVEGRPMQVARLESAPLDLLDFSGRSIADRRAAAQEYARRPFDIASEPLVRGQLLSTSPDDHLLAVTLHHLVSDGISLGILVRELADLYQALAGSSGSTLAPLPCQYGDFAAAQRGWLKDDELQRQISFWRDALSDAPEAIELPADRPRPPRPSFAGGSVTFAVPGDASIGRFASDSGATPFMILLAAYAALLSRTSGQDDVVIGVPVANRSAEGADRLVGFFVNALPIRVRCDAAGSFADLVRQTKDTVLDALAHSETPWEHVLDALAPRRDMSRPPVFQVTFTLQEEPAAAFQIPGLLFEPVPLDTGAAKFELSLEIATQPGGGLTATLEYNSDLFDEDTARSFARRYLRFLDRALAAPAAPLSRISLIDDDERAAIERAWRGQDIAFELPSNLGRAFTSAARRVPGRPAVIVGERAVSFAELEREARRIAGQVTAAGITRGDTVAIVVDRSIETIAAIFGVVLAGAAYVPLDAAWPAARRRQVIELAGARLFDEVAGTVSGSGAASTVSSTGAQASDPAYVLFTSGSTGTPKGVVVEQRSVLQLIAALEHAVYAPLGLGEECRVSVNGALTFDTSVKQIFQLLQGRTLVLVPEDVRLDGAALLNYASRTGIDVLDCTPSQLALLADAGIGSGRATVRAIFSGGEALTPALWRRLRGPDAPRVVNLYGPTECTVDATSCVLDRDKDAPVLGRPLPNVQVMILDERQEPAAIGMPGEIVIGGAGVARGYLHDPVATGARFVANPFPGIGGARVYRTGDRGRLRADGMLEYLGRVDHQVKIRGHRIELGEIEGALGRHPAVQSACAVVTAGNEGGRLVAAVALEPLNSPTVNGRPRYRLPNDLAIAQLNRNETDFLYREIFERNPYLRHGVTVQAGDVIVDVGSNIGLFTLSQHVAHEGLRVVCVEPNPHVRELLVDNLNLFGVDATVYDCGISAEEGVADFTFYPGFSILSGLHANADDERAVVRSYIRRELEDRAADVSAPPSAADVDEILDAKFRFITLPVRLRPLRDVIAASGVPRIDLLKINVEKAELDVLRSIDSAQWPLVRQVAVEVHDVDGRLDAVLTLLRRHGLDTTVEEDWSLERTAGTNYYVYAVRKEALRTKTPAPAAAAERLRRFTPPFVTGSDLRLYLEGQLPEYMVPASIAVAERLPLNAHGKVDRRAIARMPWDPERDSIDEPMSDHERQVAEDWCGVLGLNAVGPRDHFFRLGGHSLSAVRLAGRLAAAFSVHVPVATIFEYPVLRDLAAYLQTSLAAEPAQAIERGSLAGALPLSSAQERLLFLENLEGGGRAYVIAGAAELKGHVDMRALRDALGDVVTRHPVLRSAFSLHDGVAEARIGDRLPGIDEEDFTGLPESDRRPAAVQSMRSRAAVPFDVASGLPVRAAVLRLGAAEQLLFVSLHHLVADGWSVALFIRELSQCYRARMLGGEASAVPGVTYYDYVRWQRTWISGARLANGVDYWTKQLAGSAPFLNLPTDYPRPDVHTHRGGTVHFNISPELRTEIEACAGRFDVTPFMFLLGVFGALLHRVSGQSDIVVGSPSAGRRHPDTEQLIGLFVNMLPLRVAVEPASTFRSLLTEVRRTTLDALAHEEVPFERIVEALRPPRLLNRHPVFQVIFALQNVPRETLDLPDVTWTPARVEAPSGRFDLELVFDEADAGYHGTLEYGADLFAPETAAHLAAHFRTLLLGVLADPDAAIGAIDLMGAAERTELHELPRREDWPKADAPFIPAHHLVAAQAALRPSAPALVYRDLTMTYGELLERVRDLAGEIRAAGVRPAETVAIYTDRSPAWVISLLAILDARAAFLPIDPDYPLERVRWMLADADAALAITQTPLWEAAGGVTTTPAIFLDRDDRPRAAAATTPSDISPDAPAYLIYTSGSTGEPKGALNTHGGLANLTRNFLEIFGTGPESRVLHFASIGFDASVIELFMALAAGSCFCLADREDILPGAPLVETLHRRRITHATLPPSVLGGMADAAFPDLTHLAAAAEPCAPEIVDRWGAGRRFFNNYGPTEAAVCATVAECRPAERRVTIGRALRGVDIAILDPSRRAVPVGVVGEICIGGAGVGIGYWRRPDLSRDKFVMTDPERTGSPRRFYCTGDLGRFLRDGTIEFLGRNDQQIKLHGFRIELGEIEAALRTCPGVRDCAVVVQRPAGEHPRLAAFVIGPALWHSSGEDANAAVAAVKDHLRARLPNYMVPPVFAEIDRLPLTANGKLDRRALEQRIVGASTAGGAMPVASDTAHAIAAIFAEVLGRPTFGVRDDFFEHGGHSLLAAQVMARVRGRLRTDLTLRVLFEAPTPRALAARVDAACATAEAPPASSARFEDRALLSPAQQRLWFLEQLGDTQSAYNVAAAAWLRGPLDAAVFAAAVNTLVDRHEALRTCYPGVNGEAVVKLVDQVPALEVVDVAGAEEDASARRTRALALAEAEGRRPFDVANGPLFRAALYRVGAEESLFVATMHHIVSDGWSIGVLAREVAGAYDAALRGAPPAPAPAVQYGDYARWLAEHTDQTRTAHHLDFWRTHLAGMPARIELPTDQPRPPVQTFRGGSVRFDIDAGCATALRELARAHDATLFMTLLSAFAVWLSRYSGDRDICVGTPVANRRVKEVESLVGLFANTVPLRNRVDGEEPFTSLLRRVREEVLDAFNHADVRFDAIVDAVQPERNLSHAPIFQVMFAMNAGLMGELRLPGLSVDAVSLESGAAKFDLTLFVDSDGDALTAALEYNADLFEAESAARMAANLRNLLGAIARSPRTAVGDLPALSERERTLLHAWNDTAAELPDVTVCDLFEAQAVRTPAADALVWDSGATSYDALERRANQLAHHLRLLGVGRDTFVAVFLERSPDLIVSLLAVLKAGGAYVPLDIQYPEARLAFMLRDSGAAIVVTTTELAMRLPAASSHVHVCLDADAGVISALPSVRVHRLTAADSLAYMIYTSGSTGMPKGVLIEHRGLANYLLWAVDAYHMREGTGAPVIGSTSFDATITSLFGPLICGQRLVLLPEGRETEALADARLTDADHTFYKITPSHLDALTTLVGEDALAGRVRELILGGEALTSAALAPWKHAAPGVMVTNEYGPTETVVGCAVFRTSAADISGVVPIGRPIANTRIHLLDDRGRPVPIGATGEIHIGGAGVARGYHARPELTAERFVRLKIDELDEAGDARLYRTGDLARWTGRGELLFLGRRDDQVKLRGHRIELGEIEAVARAFPGVAQAAAVLQRRSRADARLALYVVSRGDQPVDTDRLAGHLADALPSVMVPSAVRAIDALPLTPNGKLDRQRLPAIGETQAPAVARGERDHVRQLLATLWAELLGAPPASPDADFFLSGGHSLLAVRLTAAIRESFSIDLPLRSVLEHPTWDGLAREIAGSRRAASPLPPIERVPGARTLSFAQERMWAIEQLDSPGAAYHVPAAFELHGALDPDALERAWHEVAGRQDVLRAFFPLRDGRAEVSVLDRLPRIPRGDLRLVPAPERGATLATELERFTTAPFDLARGPVARAALWRLQDEKWVFAVVMHHIVSDGGSATVLARELSAAYERALSDAPESAPALQVVYTDFAAWQRRVLDGPALERLTDYWRTSLAGAPPTIELPTDFTRPPAQSYRGRAREFHLDEIQRSRLLTFARREGVTLPMVFLAAYAAMLAQWSGQDDLVVGMPMANRSADGTQELVGLFVNTVPLRFTLTPDSTFAGLLAHVRETVLRAFDHQDLPFERLVDVLSVPRNPASAPVFQTLFTYQRVDEAGLTLPGVEVSALPLPHQAARLDITLAIDERAAGIDGCIEYCSDLFRESTIEAASERLIATLEAMAANVDAAVADVPLTASDRAQLTAWNNTRTDYGEARLIHEMIADQAQRRPDAVALVFEGRTMSYGELNARAEAVAAQLRAAGVGPDTPVGISLERSFELLVAVLGVLMAGGAYVPLDTEYPEARLAAMRDDARLSIVITRETIDDWARRRSDASGAAVAAPARPSEGSLAYVIFTSGSTGRPKGVMIEHRAIRNRLLWMQQRYQLSASDVVLQKTPVSFDVSVWELFWPLMYGARLVIARPGGHRDAAYLRQLIADAGVTTLHFVPAMLQAFLDEPGVEDLRGLRRVFCSGEALSWTLARRLDDRLGCPLHNLYGPTEAAVDVTAWECRLDPKGRDRTVPIGSPIANTRIHILDRERRPVPIGVSGELYIGGVNLARGYINRPDLTAERFVPNPFAARDPDESERLYRTGDRARWLESGDVEFLGRLDAQVKLRGFRIELGEIETVLLQHPDVAEAVAALRDAAGHPQLVGYIVTRGGRALDVADVRRHLQDRLPEYMVPASFVSLARLPLTPSGKVDRNALPAAETAPGRAPETAIERILASIWEELLGSTAIGCDQNFFELGGDSILAIQMAARARRAGLHVTPRLLLEHQTIETLATAAAAAHPIDAEQGALEGLAPAPPIVRWFLDQRLTAPDHFNQSVLVTTTPGLDASIIGRALTTIVTHHDSLRLKWTSKGADQLSYGPVEGACAYEAIDVSGLRDEERTLVIESTAARLQASLDTADGPLTRVAYFDAGDHAPGRLLWVAHHLVVDAVSWGILLEDLERVCVRIGEGREPMLPPKTSSWRQWTESWRDASTSAALGVQKRFWTSMPFAEALAPQVPRSQHEITMSDRLPETRSRQLAIDWPRTHRLSTQDVLLAALKTAWSEVTGATHLAVDVEGHGRSSPAPAIDVSRTVGWFTAVYPLVVGPSRDSLAAVRALTEQVRDGGAAFGALKYLAGDADIAALPRPPVLFNYLGRMDEALPESVLFSAAAEHAGPASDPRNRSPYAVELVAAFAGGAITLQWRAPVGGLGHDALARLAEVMRDTLIAMPEPDARVEATPAPAPSGGYTPVVRLRSRASAEPPWFFVHPGGGTVLPYRELAEQLDATTFGLQAPGLSPGEEAIASVEQLAACYVDAIAAACPPGPIRLGGWSFGGIVAFEMAHQLRAGGRLVDRLAVLDVHAPGVLPDAEWTREHSSLLFDIFADDLGVTHDDLRSRTLDEQLAFITARAVAAGVFPRGFTVEMARRMWDVFQTHRRAERAYRARPLAGAILLLTSDARRGEIDPCLGWNQWVDRVVRLAVPGNHQQMLRGSSVATVAAALQAPL